jgi:hypothetical protein
MATSTTTTITARLSPQLLDRLNDHAKRAGQNRNAYILSRLNYACDRSVVFAEVWCSACCCSRASRSRSVMVRRGAAGW